MNFVIKLIGINDYVTKLNLKSTKPEKPLKILHFRSSISISRDLI